MKESDLSLPDGRVLHVYDTGPAEVTVFWHHGTPNIGTPPPLGDDVRWVSCDRPGYRTSTPVPGRDLASAARDVEAVADALGLGEFVALGHSGGGSHALATAAVLGDRVRAVAALAAVAPYGGFDFFAGMRDPGSLRAALRGRAAKAAYEASAGFDPEVFTPADRAALRGAQSWLADVVDPGCPDGLIDDDIAYVSPWGCDPASITAPVLLLHGDEDRMVPFAHGQRLAALCPAAQWRPCPGAGHLSVLDHARAALSWLVAQQRE